MCRTVGCMKVAVEISEFFMFRFYFSDKRAVCFASSADYRR